MCSSLWICAKLWRQYFKGLKFEKHWFYMFLYLRNRSRVLSCGLGPLRVSVVPQLLVRSHWHAPALLPAPNPSSHPELCAQLEDGKGGVGLSFFGSSRFRPFLIKQRVNEWVDLSQWILSIQGNWWRNNERHGSLSSCTIYSPSQRVARQYAT